MIVTPFINPPAVTPEVLARAESLRTHVPRRVAERERGEVHARRRHRGAHRRGARTLRQRTARPPAPSTGIRRPTPPASPSSTAAASRSSPTPSAIGPSASPSTPTRRRRRATVAGRPALPRRAHREPERRRHPALRRARRDRQHAAAARHPRRQQPQRLGQGDRPRARARGRWPWERLRAGGARLAFGSDWPVVTLDPWQGLRMLRTRQTLKGDAARRLAARRADHHRAGHRGLHPRRGLRRPARDRPRGRSSPARSPI